MQDRFHFFCGSTDAVSGKFNLVLANLHAEVLVQLASDLVRLTGRHLLLCGVLADREGSVRTAFARLDPPAERRQEDRWVLLRYDRRSESEPRRG